MYHQPCMQPRNVFGAGSHIAVVDIGEQVNTKDTELVPSTKNPESQL